MTFESAAKLFDPWPGLKVTISKAEIACWKHLVHPIVTASEENLASLGLFPCKRLNIADLRAWVAQCITHCLPHALGESGSDTAPAERIWTRVNLTLVLVMGVGGHHVLHQNSWTGLWSWKAARLPFSAGWSRANAFVAEIYLKCRSGCPFAAEVGGRFRHSFSSTRDASLGCLRLGNVLCICICQCC